MLEDRLSATPEASFVAAFAARDPHESPVVISAIADAVGRHGSNDQDKIPLELGGSAKSVIALLRAWADTLIADPSSSRSQLGSVAIAIGRLARPELLDTLELLRDEDTRRWRDVRQRARTPQGRASIDLRSDAAISYTLQYRHAFARMGEAAAAPLIGYLEDEQFGADAALALKTIFERKYGIEKQQSLFRRWPYLEEAALRRKQGPVEGDTTYSDAMFTSAERLMASGSTSEQDGLATALARVAIALPHRDKDDVITRVLAIPQPARTKYGVVASLVMAGQTFEADLALAAISEWIVDAKRNLWRFDQSIWEVIGWLELLPFSNRPSAILEGVQMVCDAVPQHDRLDASRIVEAAGAAPDISEAQLIDMLRRFPALARQQEWAEAFLNRGTVSAATAVIEIVKEGLLGSGQGAVDSWWLSKRLASLAIEHPELKMTILCEYEMATGPAHHLLEHAMQKIGGADCVLALVRGYARAKKCFDGSLHQALEHTAIEYHSVGGSNLYDLHPVSIAPLRKELFAMMQAPNASLARIAHAALINIDIIRDNYGAVESEPRHPDIASGKPWPPEAADDEPPATAM